MTTEPAIIVDNIKKSFKIPLDGSSGIKQHLINFYKQKKGYRTFEVLKGISFEIEKGEFFGIVGRNGSGKSTLLKMLAGVYKPDSGGIAINGTLTPFIELGVGFNPELTGRENVYLNGALLGFSNKQMDAMYEEIVDFAELHDFMEERLKNYSSGMQVRLAFSIAIRADTDILLLDEVLAVGDEAFQKKCFEYFDELKKEKKTVVLVTHDMGSVKRFCTKAILIEDGEIKALGSPEDVANQYTLDNFSKTEENESRTTENMSVSRNVTSLRILPKSLPLLDREDILEFDVEYEYQNNIDNLYLGIGILHNGISLIEDGTNGIEAVSNDGKKIVYSYRLPLGRFTQGNFMVTAAVLTVDTVELVAFTQHDGNFTFTVTNKNKNSVGGVLIDTGEWV